jgi:hypothetical protein
MAKMRQVVVGTFYLGHEACELILRDGTGGEFYVTPSAGHIARIKVGADDGPWHQILNRMLHEVMELSLHRAGARYDCTRDQACDSAGFVFILDHHAFTECCARAAEFLGEAVPQLQRAWRSWNRKPAPKKAKAKGKR